MDPFERLQRQQNHQQLLIRWLYLTTFMIFVIGLVLIWVVLQVDRDIDRLNDDGVVLRRHVELVEVNHRILCEVYPQAC